MANKPFNTSKPDHSFSQKRKNLVFSFAGLILIFWVFVFSAMAADGDGYDASEVDSPPKLVRKMPVKYPPDAK